MTELTAFINLVRKTVIKVIPGARVSRSDRVATPFPAQLSSNQIKITSQILDAKLDENNIEIRVQAKRDRNAGVFAYYPFNGSELITDSLENCSVALSISDPEYSEKLEKLIRDAVNAGYNSTIDDTNKWWLERTQAFTAR